MQFLESKDFDLLQKLFNTQTITMSQFQKWDKPEEGSLMEVIKQNHETIKDGPWIRDLIKELKITRFNQPQIDASIFSQLAINPESIVAIIKSSIYPLSIVANNLWVGVLRADTELTSIPDVFPGFSRIFFCAISPREARLLDDALLRYGRQVHKWMLDPGVIR
jgi:hypothetical protein